MSLKNLRDLTGCWEWIEKALRQNPQKIDTLFIGAEVREELGDLAGAVKLFERVLQSPPLCSSCPMDTEAMKAKSLLHLGRLYLKAGEKGKSEGALRKCTESYPALAIAYGELGDLLMKQERIKEALEIFQNSIKQRLGDRRAYLGLAKALALTGKIQEAAAILEEMKELFLISSISDPKGAVLPARN